MGVIVFEVTTQQSRNHQDLVFFHMYLMLQIDSDCEITSAREQRGKQRHFYRDSKGIVSNLKVEFNYSSFPVLNEHCFSRNSLHESCRADI